jgi:hypothetical protein
MGCPVLRSIVYGMVIEHGTHTSERDAFLLGSFDDHLDADAGGKDRMGDC